MSFGTITIFQERGEMARRRLQKTGYLFEKSGAWRLRYRVDEIDANCNVVRKYVQKTIGIAVGKGRITKREAERIVWDDYLSKLDQLSTRPGSMMQLSDFVEKHFRPDRYYLLKPKGREHYDSMFKCHVLPRLGSKALREFTPVDVAGLAKEMTLKGLSPQTVIHARNVLSAVFRLAKMKGLFTGDLPTEGVRMPQRRPQERGALTWTQVEAIVAAIPQVIKDDYRNTPEVVKRYQVLVKLLAVTGMRINEALALTWSSLSETEMTLTVSATVTKAAMRYREDCSPTCLPKSARGIRKIPIASWMLWEMLSIGRNSGWIFSSGNGTPLDSNHFRPRVFQPAARLAGIEGPVSPHWMRHTANELMAAAGMSSKDRMSVMGHASERVNAIYLHADQKRIREAMETLGKPKPKLELVKKA